MAKKNLQICCVVMGLLLGGQVELIWGSATEATYRLQSSPDLDSWLDVEGPVPGTGELMQRAVSAQQRQEFFRVLAEPVSNSPAP